MNKDNNKKKPYNLDVYYSAPLIKVASTKLGELQLRRTTVRDLQSQLTLASSKISDREFAIRFVKHQASEPKKMSLKLLRSLSNPDLLLILKSYLKVEKVYELKITEITFKRLREAVKKAPANLIKPIKLDYIVPDFSKAFLGTRGITESFISAHKSIANAMVGFQTSTSILQSTFDGITRSITQFQDLFKNLDKAGLTPNLGPDRSVTRLKEYKRLLNSGYPIFWIPSAEVIDELIGATSESDRKKVILNRRVQILDDCNKALGAIKQKALKNHVTHLQSAVMAMREGNGRAAQSTAGVSIDAQFDLLVDLKTITHFRHIAKRLEADSASLKNVDEIPVKYLFGALQATLIIFLLKKFDRLKKNTVATKFRRHSSIHSVSSRQYNDFNAMQGIMIATSLLVTTSRLGAGWFSSLASIAKPKKG